MLFEIKNRNSFNHFMYFRALASSAPIWQFPGMVPCGDFYKIVTQDFAKSGYNCDRNIRRSWKAINNVSSTGKSSGVDSCAGNVSDLGLVTL